MKKIIKLIIFVVIVVLIVKYGDKISQKIFKVNFIENELVNYLYTGEGLPKALNDEEEKDLIMYYKNLTKGKETIILPKLKSDSLASYQYNLN